MSYDDAEPEVMDASHNPLLKNLSFLKSRGHTVKQTSIRFPLGVYERLVLRQLVTGRSENAEVIHLVQFALRVIDRIDKDAADELITRAVQSIECSDPSEDPG